MLDSERKFVSFMVIIFVLLAVGLGGLNLVQIYKIKKSASLRTEIVETEKVINSRIEKLETDVNTSHVAIKAIISRVDEHNVVINKQDEAINKQNVRSVKNEKDIDKLNAKLNELIYHRTWEIKKKILENRTKLIRQGIWKE
jgi:biopolymer transport protein ExbB/TolQ